MNTGPRGNVAGADPRNPTAEQVVAASQGNHEDRILWFYLAGMRVGVMLNPYPNTRFMELNGVFYFDADYRLPGEAELIIRESTLVMYDPWTKRIEFGCQETQLAIHIS